MIADPTFHSLSYHGQAFPVSAYPFGPNAGSGSFWSVMTPDGRWHVVCQRESNADAKAERRRAERVITAWLADYLSAGS
jgi:hypothetical protein